MTRQVKVGITRISRGSMERAEIGTWLLQCYADPTVDDGTVLHFLDVIDAEPTSAARARAVLRARAQQADLLIMIDNDMVPPPDFYSRAVRFLADHPGPVAFASPYRGAAPRRDVQVVSTAALRYTVAEAARRRHIEQVASVGMGIFAANMAAYDAVERAGLLPWFDYEYADPPHNSEVACTEDIHFCNLLNKAGGKVYVDWESWSLHAKVELVGKAEPAIDAAGWTHGLEGFYTQAVAALPDGAVFVEVGVFQGKSLIYAAQEARRLGKRLRFVAVDHFRGSPELQRLDVVRAGRLEETFRANLVKHRVEDVEVVPLASVEAAATRPDAGADLVFIDADHAYESVRDDIRAWLPKVRPGGLLAGHDWHGFPGVQRAVVELLPAAEVMEDCWVYRVPASKEVARG